MKRGDIAATMEGKVLISIPLARSTIAATAMALAPAGPVPTTMHPAARLFPAGLQKDSESRISKRLSRTAAVTALAVALATGPASAAPRYVAVMIDAPPRLNAFASGINASGDVAGALVPDYAWFREGGRAFRYVGGVLQQLQLGDDWRYRRCRHQRRRAGRGQRARRVPAVLG
jgi:hypothetical protein